MFLVQFLFNLLLKELIMLTFKLLDDTTYTETFVQINPAHIVSTETVVDVEWIEEVDLHCHVVYTNYELVTGMHLQVSIVLPVIDYSYNRETDKWDIPYEIPREDFVEFLKNGLNFNVVRINWGK